MFYTPGEDDMRESVFVGRKKETAVLPVAWRKARAGRGGSM